MCQQAVMGLPVSMLGVPPHVSVVYAFQCNFKAPLQYDGLHQRNLRSTVHVKSVSLAILMYDLARFERIRLARVAVFRMDAKVNRIFLVHICHFFHANLRPCLTRQARSPRNCNP
jgi:hypothetical protein